MDYNLAKELKEAGFPQEINDGIRHIDNVKGTDVYYPTLSELIEACGGVMLDGMPESWSACVHRGTTCVEGTTPEEVVANLWLALNKKT